MSGVGGAANGGVGTSGNVASSAARASNAASVKASASGRAATSKTALGSSAKAGNSGKNTVGYAKDGVSGDYDKHRSNDAGDDVGKGRKGKKVLYGFISEGPQASKVPAEARDPKKKKSVSVKVAEANQDAHVASSKRKINHTTVTIANAGNSLSHNRVGKAQKMSTFGSHRRSHNWIQPGVAKAQLLGPFSDHLRFKQMLSQGSS